MTPLTRVSGYRPATRSYTASWASASLMAVASHGYRTHLTKA